MNGAKAIVGVLLLYALAYGGVVGWLHALQRSEQAQLAALARLGEDKAVLASEAMAPLWKACQGKLVTGDPQAIVGYVAWLESAKKPVFEGTQWSLDQSVVGLQRDFLYEREEKLQLTQRKVAMRSTWGALPFQALLDPFSWVGRLQHQQRHASDLEKVKYLVVARYDSVTLPRVDGERFSSGTGRYGARVVAVPSGEVLCEGRGVATMPLEVRSGGSGATQAEAKDDAEERVVELVPFVFTEGVLASPLHMVCSIGGDGLCSETVRWAGYHPDVYGP